MMTKTKTGKRPRSKAGSVPPPPLKIKRLGIVARDYNHEYPNGHFDFSHSLPKVLSVLDQRGCDAVLFSLYSIAGHFDPRQRQLRQIKSIFLEEFDGDSWEAKRYVVHHRATGGWKEYEFHQQFGQSSEVPSRIDGFVKEELPRRILGNCCVLLCGESNGVTYSRTEARVDDRFRIRARIPDLVDVILNPIHDRMTRYEMKFKRQYLSGKGRWVISVWNKGKIFRDGKTRDGHGPAWTVYYSGRELAVERIPNELDVEIGIVDLAKTRAR